jgi:hypothetical protein
MTKRPAKRAPASLGDASKASKVTMTPEWAKMLLAQNPHNRPISRPHVAKLAHDMKTPGLWKVNGDAIRRAKDGSLLDGQHRLRACIDAGVPFETYFIDGLEPDVLPTIDGGKKRSAADVINMMHGHSLSAAGIAASVRQILNYLAGEHPNNTHSTPSIFDFVAHHPDISEIHRLGALASGIITPGPTGAVLFLATREPSFRKRAEEFIHGVKTGDNLRIGDPRLALRNAGMNARAGAPGKRLSVHWWLVAIILAWNAYATRKKLEKIQVRLNRKDGSTNVPDVIGGPPRGSGMEGLEKGLRSTDDVAAE